MSWPDLKQLRIFNASYISKTGNWTNCMWYLPPFLKPRVTAAMPNPSEAIKRMPPNPPITPPTMVIIRFRLLPERTALKVCMYVCTKYYITCTRVIMGFIAPEAYELPKGRQRSV